MGWFRLKGQMRAFLFPGQGSQYCGMGLDVVQAYPEARQAFEEADEALGMRLSRLCWEGPEAQLILTENTQPAVLTTSVAFLRVLQKRGLTADFVAGHSLGEYSALVAAGSLSFTDAVQVVRLRGRFMQEAVPVGRGAMGAVLGMGPGELQEICDAAAQGQVVSAANINSPRQIVIAGDAEAVERASKLALDRGALKVLPLPVSAPFHCRLMEPAQERLAEVLSQIEFRDLLLPLLNNVDGAEITKGEEARQGLVRQVSSTVRWTDCISALLARGVTSFVEVGPGRVLTGLLRQMDRSAEASTVGTRDQLDAWISQDWVRGQRCAKDGSPGNDSRY